MSEASLSTSYDRSWQTELDLSSSRSASVVVPVVLELVTAKSVVDVGCGTGAWLSAFRAHGIDDVLGLDGPWIDPVRLHIPADRFISCDLSQPIRLDRRFDLAVSLEVAEHLSSEAAATFVESLTGLAPVVLFSAAIPGQEGNQHVNEQWPDYWVRLFQARGYTAVDCIRPAIWNSPEVDFWYAQNTLLMVAEASLEQVLSIQMLHRVPAQMLRVVHPRLLELRERERRSSLVRQAFSRSLRKRPALRAIARRIRARWPGAHPTAKQGDRIWG